METYFQRYILAGGVMMFFLIPCSLFAIAYIVQGLINLRRSKLIPAELAPLLKGEPSDTNIENLKQFLATDESVLGRIIQRILHNSSGSQLSTRQLNDITADEISRLYQRNSQLTVIYTVAPLLGLLGTILGMMKSFYLFSTTTNPSVAQLSYGINEALVTTMWGLFIAIPSFLVVNIFRYRLLKYQREILPELAEKIIRTMSNVQQESPVPDKDETYKNNEPPEE
ncbi:MotA/TolQ/ExbB proton channel family protein [Candidatus Sumerlaeota bacterium]|nr:MotA/TolQ/ExbB proton channel family protein [Candidatus Sumerlaeota bacterium]